ncbi:MAG: hypothetical protein ACC658_11805, partial [Acidimicrobiia bacterium]
PCSASRRERRSDSISSSSFRMSNFTRRGGPDPDQHVTGHLPVEIIPPDRDVTRFGRLAFLSTNSDHICRKCISLRIIFCFNLINHASADFIDHASAGGIAPDNESIPPR